LSSRNTAYLVNLSFFKNNMKKVVDKYPCRVYNVNTPRGYVKGENADG
jgi:hypothetical protein